MSVIRTKKDKNFTAMSNHLIYEHPKMSKPTFENPMFENPIFENSLSPCGNERTIVREHQIHLRVSPDEYELIQQKLKQSGCGNLSAYLRKMATDGLIVNLDMPELKEISRQLRYNGNNLNQIAKRLNEGGGVYSEDISEIKEKQTEITDLVRRIYLQLCKL